PDCFIINILPVASNKCGNQKQEGASGLVKIGNQRIAETKMVTRGNVNSCGSAAGIKLIALHPVEQQSDGSFAFSLMRYWHLADEWEGGHFRETGNASGRVEGFEAARGRGSYRYYRTI